MNVYLINTLETATCIGADNFKQAITKFEGYCLLHEEMKRQLEKYGITSITCIATDLLI